MEDSYAAGIQSRVPGFIGSPGCPNGFWVEAAFVRCGARLLTAPPLGAATCGTPHGDLETFGRPGGRVRDAAHNPRVESPVSLGHREIHLADLWNYPIPPGAILNPGNDSQSIESSLICRELLPPWKWAQSARRGHGESAMKRLVSRKLAAAILVCTVAVDQWWLPGEHDGLAVLPVCRRACRGTNCSLVRGQEGHQKTAGAGLCRHRFAL